MPYEADLVVNRNETTLLQISLVDESSLKPWYYKWWVWTSAGALLVGGVTLAYLLQDNTTAIVITSPLP